MLLSLLTLIWILTFLQIGIQGKQVYYKPYSEVVNVLYTRDKKEIHALTKNKSNEAIKSFCVEKCSMRTSPESK